MTDRDYVSDVFRLLLERAHVARQKAHDQSAGPEDSAFAAGLMQGYYETISVMLGQLEAFGIERASVAVPEDLSPERDLL